MVSAALDGYLLRMKGQRYDPSKLKLTPQPPSRFAVLLSSFIGSFVGIAILASLTYNANWFLERNTPVIAGSFGASAVLIYGAIESPLSQPRNVIGGHIMSSLIGVSLYKLFNLLSDEMFVKLHWLLCSLAVSVSLFLMQLTHTVHPPASASALIAVTGGAQIYDLGYWYVLCPIALGVAIMMTVALVVNNVARRYPTHWWKPKERKITVVDQDLSTALAEFTNPEDEEEEDNSTNVEDDHQKHGAADTVVDPLENAQTSDAVSHKKVEMISSPSLEQIQQQAQSPQTSHHSHGQHLHPHQHHGQLAVYYGGDRNEALKEGERLQQSPRVRPQASPDIEHGHSPQNPRPTSIVMEAVGSPHPSHPPMSAAAEEEYRAIIEQLRHRIHELESQTQTSSR